MICWTSSSGTCRLDGNEAVRKGAHARTEKVQRPEDLTRLFVERANDGDAAGIAALYEEGAVMAYPPGERTVGREAIRALWSKVLANAPHFEQEAPLPTLISGDIASRPPLPGRRRCPGTGGPPPARRHVAASARPAGVRAPDRLMPRPAGPSLRSLLYVLRRPH